MPWIRSASWDALWIQSALWLAPIAFLLARGYENPTQSPLDGLFFALTALFWIGHRLGSAWLAYFTTAYRPLLAAQPVRFVIAPLGIAAACCIVLLPGDDAFPLTRAERVVALVLLDYLFVTYHFAAQHFGVLSLYRIRSGRAASAWTRRVDQLFALGVGGAMVVLAEAVGELNVFQGEWLAWLDRSWLEASAGWLRTGAAALVATATLAMLVLEVRARRPSLPRLLYAGGVAGMVACALYLERPFLFVVMWTAQHWLAASALATRVAQAEPAPRGSTRGSWLRGALHAINRRPWALLLVLATLSTLLMPVMEVEAASAEGVSYGERLFGALAIALRESNWVPALLALGFASGYLHYWLDRAVYRLSDPGVRAAARGLLEPAYFTSSSSTSKTSVALGGMTPPAPRLP
ncbi:MAG: hypothetical protein ACRET8_09135 [Burkholderiales bacterium]